jgi:hypothetical protein
MLRGVSDDPSPLFRVVRGTPTPEELAALVGAFAARRPAAPPQSGDSSFWVYRSRPGAISPAGLFARCGTSAWRASGLPR